MGQRADEKQRAGWIEKRRWRILKMRSTTVDFAMRRFKEKAFAKGASREQMASCETFGFSLEDFMRLGIDAMTEVSDEIGLQRVIGTLQLNAFTC